MSWSELSMAALFFTSLSLVCFSHKFSSSLEIIWRRAVRARSLKDA